MMLVGQVLPVPYSASLALFYGKNQYLGLR